MTQNMNQVVNYPMSLQYRNHWNQWEAMREFYQNAMDITQSTNCAQWKAYRQGNDAIIQDFGTGLTLDCLSFGESTKTEESRGKFGEGMKVALIVLKRLGLNCIIQSRNLTITTSTWVMGSKTCLQLVVSEGSQIFEGTRITVKDYFSKFETMYLDRILMNSDKAIFTDSSYGSILENEGSSKLYVKDIYICDLQNAAYSYNLKNCKLEESRNVADSWSLNRQIGALWEEVNTKALFEKLFTAIKDKKMEQNCNLDNGFTHEETFKKAFYDMYGNGAVLKTSDDSEREAEWRGATVCDVFNNYTHSAMFSIIKTDSEYVAEDMAKKIVYVDEITLTDVEKSNLRLARRCANEFDSRIKVVVCVLPTGRLGESPLGNTEQPIKLDRSILSNQNRTIGTMTHELVHMVYGAEDMTRAFIEGFEKISVKLLGLYLSEQKNGFSTKILEKRNGQYVQYCINIPKELIEELNLQKGSTIRTAIFN